MTYKEMLKERVKINRSGRSRGFKGGLNIILNPLSVFSFLLGIILIIFGLTKDSLALAFIVGGISLAVFGILQKFHGILNSGIISILIFMLYPVIDISFSALSGRFTNEDFMFLEGYAPLVVAVILLYILSIFLKSRMLRKPLFTFFDGDGKAIAIDMTLFHLCPVAGYKFLITVSVPNLYTAITKQALNQFYKINAGLYSKKIILASGVFSKTSGAESKYYAYTDDLNNIEYISDYLSANGISCSVAYVEDPDWNKYKSELMPDEYVLNEIYNGNLYMNLSRGKYDMAKISRLGYFVSFDNTSDAEACVKNAENGGFKLYNHGKSPIKEEKIGSKSIYIVILELESRLGLERLNMNSGNIIDFAKKFNGHLHHWALLGEKQ